MEDVVDDLRWALARAPDDDPATRCRLQLSLAVELYYVPESSAERRALVDTGLALARRVADPELTWWAMRTAWMASWAPPHLVERMGWSEEGLVAARRAGDPAAEAVLLTTLAVDELELGRVDLWEEHSAAAVAIARRERLPYVMFTVHWVRMTLAAMRGDRAGVAEHLAGLETTLARGGAADGRGPRARGRHDRLALGRHGRRDGRPDARGLRALGPDRRTGAPDAGPGRSPRRPAQAPARLPRDRGTTSRSGRSSATGAWRRRRPPPSATSTWPGGAAPCWRRTPTGSPSPAPQPASGRSAATSPSRPRRPATGKRRVSTRPRPTTPRPGGAGTPTSTGSTRPVTRLGF